MDSTTYGLGNVIYRKNRKKLVELFQPTQVDDDDYDDWDDDDDGDDDDDDDKEGGKVHDLLFDSECQRQRWKQVGNEETNPHFSVCK